MTLEDTQKNNTNQIKILNFKCFICGKQASALTFAKCQNLIYLCLNLGLNQDTYFGLN